MTLEDLIEDIGSFGRFQILIILIAGTPKMLFGWSMVIPVVAGVVPDWWCVPEGQDLNTTMGNSSVYKQCPVANNTCIRVYSDSMVTAVSQWDLVCEKGQVSKTIASLQMAGVMVGVALAGQISDTFGRKKIFFLNMGLHSVFCFIGALSVSWQMYAAVRFLVGMTIGAFLGTSIPHLMEFMGCKWRAVVTALPLWPVGGILCAFFGYLIPNWRYLHVASGVLSAPFLFGCFFVPESMRWLTVKGRLDEAEAVVDLIARHNGRTKPENTRSRLEDVAKKELEKRKTYTYLDTFHGWIMAKKTILCAFIWFTCSVTYYGMMFGVHSLSGDVFLNIILLQLVEIPVYVSTFWLNNKFGRKWTAFGFLLLAGFAMCGSLGVYLASDRGIIVNVLALVGKFGIGGGWMVMYLFTNEIYPTVIRSLGFGVCQTASRIGGVVAPMLLLMDENNILVPFIVMGGMLMISCVCLVLLPETKDTPLQDSLRHPGTLGHRSESKTFDLTERCNSETEQI
ncbi:solute carrier family 22 member 15-like [Haliotis rufescens]|uniref:solute carrier family 22 member 15-like n=1 Tax=Haliotis rufescens TaxID=6454 RepID=UPI00201F849D|nr:solute carrier family 22 member 15-like [Haliotis rufescens]